MKDKKLEESSKNIIRHIENYTIDNGLTTLDLISVLLPLTITIFRQSTDNDEDIIVVVKKWMEINDGERGRIDSIKGY